MEDLERGLLNYEVVGKFLANLKEEFRGGNKKVIKVVELRKVEQGGKNLYRSLREQLREVVIKKGL